MLDGHLPSMALAGVSPIHRLPVFVVISLLGSLRASLRFSHGVPVWSSFVPIWLAQVAQALAFFHPADFQQYSNLFQGLWQIAREYELEGVLGLPINIVARASVWTPFGLNGRNMLVTTRTFSLDQAFPAPRACGPCLIRMSTCYITGSRTACVCCTAHNDSGKPRLPCAYESVSFLSFSVS